MSTKSWDVLLISLHLFGLSPASLPIIFPKRYIYRGQLPKRASQDLVDIIMESWNCAMQLSVPRPWFYFDLLPRGFAKPLTLLCLLHKLGWLIFEEPVSRCEELECMSIIVNKNLNLLTVVDLSWPELIWEQIKLPKNDFHHQNLLIHVYYCQQEPGPIDCSWFELTWVDLRKD